MKKIVIALGGNALQEAGKPATAEAQLEEVEKTAEYIADIIEAGYKELVDEMWYIYASDDVRRERLKASRGYSDEKVTAIMNGQLKEDEFRRACQVVIDNSGDMEDTKKQIDKILGDRLWKVQENFPDN